MPKVVILRGLRACCGMGITDNPDKPTPLGHMNLDFFVDAFKAYAWEVVPGPQTTSVEVNLDFVEQHKPEVVLWPDSARWHPKKRLPCLVIHYINDSHNFVPKLWRGNQVNGFVVRHPQGNKKIQSVAPKIPILHLRFSINPKWLPNPISKIKERRDSVVFLGSSYPYLYPKRHAAIEALRDQDLIRDYGAKKQRITKGAWVAQGLEDIALNKVAKNGMNEYHSYHTIHPQEYFKKLAQGKLGLTSSSIIKLVLNKDLEIPACGTVLLTDGLGQGFSDWLPQEAYLKYTSPHSIARLVLDALKDEPKLQAMADLGRKHVLKHHLDQHRYPVFMNWLKTL